ncbi:MAG: hypothetical protein WCL37_00690 [Chrysiogenales bacterium]
MPKELPPAGGPTFPIETFYIEIYVSYRQETNAYPLSEGEMNALIPSSVKNCGYH